MIKNNKKSPIIFTIISILIIYFPFLLLFFLGFSSNITFSDSVLNTSGFNNLFHNYTFLDSILMTILIGIISSIFSTIIGFFLVISLSMLWKKVRYFSYSIIKIPLLNPDICNSLVVVFIFIFMTIKFGMVTFISSHIFLTLPYVIFILYPAALRVKNSYIESAQDLGASYWCLIRKIYFPIMFKQIIIVLFLSFAISIDDFIFSFLNSGHYSNVSTLIYSMKIIRPFLYSFGLMMFVFFMLIYFLYIAYLYRKNIVLFFSYVFLFRHKSSLYLMKQRKNIFAFPMVIKIQKYLFFGLITSMIILIITYFFIVENNSIFLYIFNGYIDGKTIDSFSKELKTRMMVTEYDTNEMFFSKTKYTSYDMAMLSDYAVSSECDNLHKFTSNDMSLFVKYYNYYSHTNYSNYKSIYSQNNYSKALFSKYSDYKVNNSYLFKYSIPYSFGDIKFMFNKSDDNSLYNKPYEKIYYDATKYKKKVVIYNDPRNIIYMGIMIAQNIDPNSVDYLSDGGVSFSNKNIFLAKKYLSKMFLHNNVVAQSDIVPTFFLNGTLDDAYVYGYNYLDWFSGSNKYFNKYNLVLPSRGNEKHDIDNVTNIWEDGFVLNKNLSKSKLNKCIKFIAYESSNSIAKKNIDDNYLSVPTNYCMKYIVDNKNFYYNNDENNVNYLLCALDKMNGYSYYQYFTNTNEDLLRKVYSEIFSNQ